MAEKDRKLAYEMVNNILSDLNSLETLGKLSFHISNDEKISIIKKWAISIDKDLVKAYGENSDEVFSGYFDGSSIPNPGEMQCGYVILNSKGFEVCRGSSKLGHGTNNRAEYCGLIKLLEAAIGEEIDHIIIHGDSEIVIKQMTHEYKVKDPKLKLLWGKAQTLVHGDFELELGGFKTVEWKRIPRDLNFVADNLSRI